MKNNQFEIREVESRNCCYCHWLDSTKHGRCSYWCDKHNIKLHDYVIENGILDKHYDFNPSRYVCPDWEKWR